MLDTVAELTFAEGSRDAIIGPNVIADGWIEDLMLTGQMTDKLGQNLDLLLASPTWSNTKVVFDKKHNNHVHIDLDDTALNNAP